MQTIKVNNYENKKALNLKKRLGDYWKTLKKNNLQYLLAIIAIQMINLILIMWLFPYVWGIAVHFVILGIILGVLLFKWLRKPKLIQFVTIVIIPAVLMSFIIAVLLIGFTPSVSFPETRGFPDNNAARMTSINKFRVSPIELQFPVTFKMEYEDLAEIVEDWIRQEGFSSNEQDIAHPLDEKELPVGKEFHFSNFQFYSLFGMVNDMHIRAIKGSDVWGGVKLEAHANIRLGLKDYNSNIRLIESLYDFVEQNTQDINRSNLLGEHLRK